MATARIANGEHFRWPSEGVTRVPYRVFVDPAIYAQEQDKIFRGPVWNYVGDDDEEMVKRRIKQANLVGPAGYISMEDGYAAEIEQQAITHDQDGCSFLEMDGTATADADNLVSEAAMRGFWQYYRSIMGF